MRSSSRGLQAWPGCAFLVQTRENQSKGRKEQWQRRACLLVAKAFQAGDRSCFRLMRGYGFPNCPFTRSWGRSQGLDRSPVLSSRWRHLRLCPPGSLCGHVASPGLTGLSAPSQLGVIC